MNQEIFDATVEKIKEIDSVLGSLDPAIRPLAFKLLEPYATQTSRVVTKDALPAEDDVGIGEFFSLHGFAKPSEAAVGLAAWHYGQHGSVAFTAEEIREMANRVGATIPTRVDMTFLGSKREGKSLFRRAGKGSFAPTVHGELYFKSAFDLEKGRRPKSTDDESE